MVETRQQSVGEEIVNSILHGLGALCSIVALSTLIMYSKTNYSTATTVSFSVFCISLFLLYLMSTLHHSISHKRTKHVFLILDYACIYILIASTYSMLFIGILKLATLGDKILLAIILVCTIVGIIMSAIFSKKIKTIAPAFYIPMGWLSMLIIYQVYLTAGATITVLIVFGGVAYTLGTYFYLHDFKKYYHAIWHIFVLLGSALHFAAFWIATIK